MIIKKEAVTFLNENHCPKINSLLREDIAHLNSPIDTTKVEAVAISEDDPTQYTSAIGSAKKHIEAGDIYQANLSRQWTVQVTS